MKKLKYTTKLEIKTVCGKWYEKEVENWWNELTQAVKDQFISYVMQEGSQAYFVIPYAQIENIELKRVYHEHSA